MDYSMRGPHIETKRRRRTKVLIRAGIQQSRDSGDSRDGAGVLAVESEGAGTDHLRTPGLGYTCRAEQTGFLCEGFAATGGAGIGEVAKAVRQ